MASKYYIWQKQKDTPFSQIYRRESLAYCKDVDS